MKKRTTKHRNQAKKSPAVKQEKQPHPEPVHWATKNWLETQKGLHGKKETVKSRHAAEGS